MYPTIYLGIKQCIRPKQLYMITSHKKKTTSYNPSNPNLVYATLTN